MATTTTPAVDASGLPASLQALLTAAGSGPQAGGAGMPPQPASAGDGSLRPGLGTRTPPQYDSLLASLQRAIY